MLHIAWIDLKTSEQQNKLVRKMKPPLKVTEGFAEAQLWVQLGPEVRAQVSLSVNDRGKLGHPTVRRPTEDIMAMPNLVGHRTFHSAWLQLMHIYESLNLKGSGSS
jgi:hypothetical protein